MEYLVHNNKPIFYARCLPVALSLPLSRTHTLDRSNCEPSYIYRYKIRHHDHAGTIFFLDLRDYTRRRLLPIDVVRKGPCGHVQFVLES